jgi:hypothetical protein
MIGSPPLLFQSLDTPGPIYHMGIDGAVFGLTVRAVEREAYAKNGLYTRTMEPISSLQTIALLLPAGVDWHTPPEPKG